MSGLPEVRWEAHVALAYKTVMLDPRKFPQFTMTVGRAMLGSICQRRVVKIGTFDNLQDYGWEFLNPLLSGIVVNAYPQSFLLPQQGLRSFAATFLSHLGVITILQIFLRDSIEAVSFWSQLSLALFPTLLTVKSGLRAVLFW